MSRPRPRSATAVIGSGALRTALGGSVVVRVSNGPTANATRYDGNGGVAANRTRFLPSPAAAVSTTGMLPITSSASGTVSATSYGTLNAGSSKHGNARRA